MSTIRAGVSPIASVRVDAVDPAPVSRPAAASSVSTERAASLAPAVWVAPPPPRVRHVHLAPAAPWSQSVSVGVLGTAACLAAGAWLIPAMGIPLVGIAVGLTLGVGLVEAWRAYRGRDVLPPLSGEALKAQLGEGRPFPADIAKAFAAIFGTKVTYDGLLNFYRPLLPPETTWEFKELDLRDEGAGVSRVDYLLQARSCDGILYQLGRYAVRHADDSVELHVNNVYLAKPFRGVGIPVRCLAMEEALLRTVSAHTETRITLAAGFSFDPNCKDPRLKDENSQCTDYDEYSGYYVWATYGFLFADSHHAWPLPTAYGKRLPSHRPQVPEDWQNEADRHILAYRFSRWIDENRDRLVTDRNLVHHAFGAKPETEVPLDKIIQALKQQVRDCVDPIDLTHVGEALDARIDNQPIARLWLTFKHMPEGFVDRSYWSGVRFVNPSPRKMRNAARQRSDAIFRPLDKRAQRQAKAWLG